MFGLGIWEIAVIMMVALIVLGPRKLPEIGRMVGKAVRELRRASSELRAGLNAEVPMEPMIRNVEPMDPPQHTAPKPEDTAPPADTASESTDDGD